MIKDNVKKLQSELPRNVELVAAAKGREPEEILEAIANLEIPNVEMKHLSMGMTNSYHVALEEGATMVRIGTKLFGERH